MGGGGIGVFLTLKLTLQMHLQGTDGGPGGSGLTFLT